MKIKRVLASFMALATVATATVAIVSAAATGSLKVSVEDTTAKAGEEFVLNVNLSNIPSTGIMGVDFAVSFDSSLVTISGVEEGPIGKTGAAEAELALDGGLASSMLDGGDYSCFDYYVTDNQICALWATGLDDSSYWIKDDGVYMTISGTVKENVEAGTKIKFDVVPVERETYPGSGTMNTDIILGYYDGSGDPVIYNVEVESGIITVEGKETNKPTETEPTETEPTETEPTETEPTTTDEELPSDFEPLYGDVNLDGDVSITDVVEFNKFIVGATEFNAMQKVNADAYYDGKLNMQDNMHIASYLCMKVSELGPTE